MVKTNKVRIFLAVLIIGSIATKSAFALMASPGCGDLKGPGQYGPFDYRTDKSKLNIVEKFHFTPKVAALIRGNTSTLPGQDLSYTLRAFPNHHKALLSLVKYGEKMKSPQPSDLEFPIECYFDRALRFQPNDTMVRIIYATFLSQSMRKPEAIQQLEQASTSAADNPFSQYNIGLIYFDLKDFDKALRQAHKAIQLGFPNTDLRDRLKSVGHWTEPPPIAATTPGAAPRDELDTTENQSLNKSPS